MKKILVGSFLEVHSNGDMAVLTSMLKALRKAAPEAQITVLISEPELTRARYKDFLEANNVDIARSPWFKQSSSRVWTLAHSGLHAVWFGLFGRGLLKRHDFYLELGTDTHTDYYGTIPFYACLYPLLLCILSKTPFVVCAQTVGPFKSRLAKRAAKFVFRRACLTTLRDKTSQGYLEELGISDTRPVADLAFLLEPAPAEEVDGMLANEGVSLPGGPLVAVSTSERIYSYSSGGRSEAGRRVHYVQLMTSLVEYIVETTGATVLLVSHDNTPRKSDESVSREIHRRAKQKDRVVVLRSDYRTDQIKGIIGRCELFVGCRMHATIAATSQHVPTVAISYGHKFQGVLAGVLRPQEDIVDIGRFATEDLFNEVTSRIRRTWDNRIQVSHEMEQRLPDIRRQALLNVQLVADLASPAVERSAGAPS